MDATWWGRYELEVGQQARWRIGPLQLFAARHGAEWRFSHASSQDARDETVEIEVPSTRAVPDDALVARFVQRESAAGLELSGVLADRPVVVKPAVPLSVVAGEEVTLYVGSPVWVRIAVGGADRHLLEVPSHRPSDTWAGPNTREGQACYASRTLAQLDLADCVVRPHRAITAVKVRNHAHDTLVVERLQLPAPLLALYATDGGVLWTQSVSLTREGQVGAAQLSIGDATAPAGGALQRIGDPRERAQGNMVAQVFNRLWKF